MCNVFQRAAAQGVASGDMTLGGGRGPISIPLGKSGIAMGQKYIDKRVDRAANDPTLLSRWEAKGTPLAKVVSTRAKIQRSSIGQPTPVGAV